MVAPKYRVVEEMFLKFTLQPDFNSPPRSLFRSTLATLPGSVPLTTFPLSPVFHCFTVLTMTLLLSFPLCSFLVPPLRLFLHVICYCSFLLNFKNHNFFLFLIHSIFNTFFTNLYTISILPSREGHPSRRHMTS